MMKLKNIGLVFSVAILAAACSSEPTNLLTECADGDLDACAGFTSDGETNLENVRMTSLTLLCLEGDVEACETVLSTASEDSAWWAILQDASACKQG